VSRARILPGLCCAAGLVGIVLLLALPMRVYYRFDGEAMYHCAAVLAVPPKADRYPEIYRTMDEHPGIDWEDDHRRLRDHTGPDSVADDCSRYRDRRLAFALVLALPTCLFGMATIRAGRD